MGKIINVLIIASVLTTFSASQDCTQIVPLNVVDRDTGSSIVPLTAEALQARMGDTALPVTALDRVRTSRIIVLIDESGSMGRSVPDISSRPDISPRQEQALQRIKQALGDLVEDLPPGVSVEYGLFNDKSLFTDAFVSDPGELRKRIDDVTARFGKTGFGKTALFDSLHEALSRLGTPQLTDTILLMTDGGDNKSQRSAKQLEREFQVAGSRLLTIMVYRPGEHLVAPDEIEQRDRVQELVRSTGGYSLAIDSTSVSWTDKKASADNVQLVRYFWQHQVLGRHVAHVQVPGALRHERKWKLLLNPDADPRLKHGVVDLSQSLESLSDFDGECSLGRQSPLLGLGGLSKTPIFHQIARSLLSFPRVPTRPQFLSWPRCKTQCALPDRCRDRPRR